MIRTEEYSLKCLLKSEYIIPCPHFPPYPRGLIPSLITLPPNISKAHFFCFRMSTLHSHSRDLDQFLHLQAQLPLSPSSRAKDPKGKSSNNATLPRMLDSLISVASDNTSRLASTLPTYSFIPPTITLGKLSIILSSPLTQIKPLVYLQRQAHSPLIPLILPPPPLTGPLIYKEKGAQIISMYPLLKAFLC